MKNPVLVTGATSAVGRNVVRSLAERGTRVRAMVQDMRKVEDAGLPGVDIRIGDLRDEEQVRTALRGVDKVYLITPLTKEMPDMTRMIVRAAEEEGVRKIVRQSVIDCGVDRRFEFWKKHRECENIVKRSSMQTTCLRLNQLMQSFIKFNGASVKAEGVIRKPCGNGFTSYLDAYDAASVAATVLDGNWYDGKTFTLTGPEPLSNDEVAMELAKATGKDVRYVDIDPATARKELIDAGYGTWYADGMMEMYKVEMESYASMVTCDVERITGCPPRRFGQFAKENASAFR